MQGKTFLFLSPVLCLLFFSQPSLAVKYIDSKPLASVVTTKAKACSSFSGNIRLPIITWGGDIATILANGNQKITKKGSTLEKLGVGVTLKREDVFKNQLKAYMNCESPFLRGTMGMLSMAAEVTEKNPMTKMQIFYQMTWSAGGDALVVKGNINTPKDLKGKTIAIQAYGPHVDYMAKILTDAGLSFSDVKVKWVVDLTGTGNTPMSAFYKSDIDAAFVIIPDALALTSDGTVGTGAEDSVKGAKILLSTKTASRVIADVYAVRSDFYEKNRELVENLAVGLIRGQADLKKIFKSKKSNPSRYSTVVKSAGKILLDSEAAINDVEGMYLDAEFVGLRGNKDFLHSSSYPRRMSRLSKEIQKSYVGMNLLSSLKKLNGIKLSYQKSNIKEKAASKPRFNQQKVKKVIARKQRQGTLKDGELYSFEVFFQPNQNEFSESLYQDAFKKVIDLASTYGGALITVEGHSDPMGFLRKKKNKETDLVLNRIKQSAKNLSLTRANAVRDSLVNYAKKKGVTLDPSQFAVLGHGIMNPRTGMCGKTPCVPKTKDEWLSNMRVSFRIIQVEAEASVFNPL